MSDKQFSVVCGGYLTKSPTSGGRGKWRLRWVELLQAKMEPGQLRLEYYSKEKKRNKAPLGETYHLTLQCCIYCTVYID